MKTNIIIIIIFFVAVQTTYSQTSIDTYANQQYYLELLNIYDAWDITLGDPNVIVTVVDSPMPDSHPDLAGNRVIQRYGPDVIENKAHGIAVAGIIGADHNSVGIKGIAPNIKFIGISNAIVNGFRSEVAIRDDMLTAFNTGSTLFNHSWSRDPAEDAMFNLEQFITSSNPAYKRIINIASIGNATIKDPIWTTNYTPYPPSTYSNAFAIGAVDQNLNKWDYSKYQGSTVQLVTPTGNVGEELAGEHPCYVNDANPGGLATKYRGDIYTLDLVGDPGYNPGTFRTNDIPDTEDDCYEYSAHENTPISDKDYVHDFGGTSASAPMVTGVVALMQSVNSTLLRNEILSILRNTSTKLPAMNGQNRTDELGYGMLNAYAAVKEALPEQYDDTTFSTSTTLGSAHIDGSTTLGSGVSLTIPADEIVVVEGSMLGAATNTHLKVHGKMIVDYDATISRVHIEVKDGGEVLVKPGATFELSTGAWNNVLVRAGGKITAHGTQAPLIPKLLLENLSLEALASHLLPTPNIGQTGNPSDRI